MKCGLCVAVLLGMSLTSLADLWTQCVSYIHNSLHPMQFCILGQQQTTHRRTYFDISPQRITDLRSLSWVCTAGVNCEMYSTGWTERSIADIEWQIDLYTSFNPGMMLVAVGAAWK